MEIKFYKNIINLIFVILIVILLNLSVHASPIFTIAGTTNYSTENSIFNYNFSSIVINTTGSLNLPWVYTIENISSNLYPANNNPSFYSWISISSLLSIMTINSTRDNQTGRFNITVKVLDNSLNGNQETFYFIVNATNDAPNFTSISNSYNFTQNISSITYINGSDEEGHFPLWFNASFTSCSLAPWSNKGSNCTLFSFRNITNSSSMINITPSKNDVGTYIANISVTDNVANCISGYCDLNYSQNITVYYARLVNFTVFAALEINISDCQNKIFQQNQSGTCILNITTKDRNDSYNVSSRGFLRNFSTTVYNASWFYYYNQSTAIDYSSSIIINVTPQVTEVGNWTINFTLWDINFSQSLMNQINVYVNKTINYAPIIQNISNQITSINSSLNISLIIYDDDMLIPDKNMNLGGYNETLNFTAGIFNQSNLTQNLTINGFYNFSVQILNMPVAGTNRTTARISFTPNMTSFGDFTINLTAIDRKGVRDSKLINLTILNNRPPNWTEVNTVMVLYEPNSTYFNFSMNVSDPDLDSINFSFTNDTSFPSFNLNITTGISNFTLTDLDVGQHIVIITARDSFYSVPKTFNFTVYNLNESPYIEKPIPQSSVFNATVDSNSNMNAVEDNLTEIDLWIQDDDFKIPLNQRGFYNETLSINLTITGVNTNLFQFTRNSLFPTVGNNRSKYQAIFTPAKSDVGIYNITINVTDNSGLSDSITFNLTIASINHAPVLMSLSDQITAINRTIYYRINATDAEDGNSATLGNTNLTFVYNFINGTDFINNNQSIFNRTTGELNITFNSSQGGIYRLNITVNDTGNKIASGSFWIYVYDIPSVNSPSVSYQFNFVENSTYNITFKANHSIRNNLTYLVYINHANINGNFNTILYNQSFYGNNSNMTFLFTPDFKNETYGARNITLVVYPSDSLLANAIDINRTVNFNITINHTNHLVTFYNNIEDSSVGSPKVLALSNYFSDLDASDVYWNQTVRFGYSSTGSTGGTITVSIVDWVDGATPSMSFSSSSEGSSTYTVTAYEYNQSNSSQIIRNVTSNSFLVNLSTSIVIVTVPSSGGGGGGGGSTPILLKIIAPGPISVYQGQKVTVPITLVNNGKNSLYGIKLSSLGFKNGKINNLVTTSLDKVSLNSLAAGAKEYFNLTFLIESNLTGVYEILLNASSDSPVYSDWAKLYINLQKINETDVKKYLLFTDEFLVQNPPCLELKELLDEANAYFDNGDYLNARSKAEQAVNACKEHVSQVSLPRTNSANKYNLNNYLIIASFGSILLGLLYYYVRRRIIKRASSKFYKQAKI